MGENLYGRKPALADLDLDGAALATQVLSLEKPHLILSELDPEKAAQYLIFASLLARRIYEAKDAPKT